MRRVQQVRLVVDRCVAAAVVESSRDEAQPIEDRRCCESVGETPGHGRLLTVNGPLQLAGRSNTRTKYPGNVIRDGFNGCIKNLLHNGQVESIKFNYFL